MTIWELEDILISCLNIPLICIRDLLMPIVLVLYVCEIVKQCLVSVC